MAFVFTLPDDPYYDYLPIDGPDIELGMDILGVITSEGTVTTVIPPGSPYWTYVTETETSWGVPDEGFAVFPDDPDSQPDNWWQRIAMWTRDDRLDDRTQMTVSDGSRWIYSAGGDGRLVCHKAGSTYARGRRLFRGQLTTDPRDLIAPEDTVYDWLPVKDGATVSVSDYVQFAWPKLGIVDDIVNAGLADGYTRTIIYQGATALGWYDTVTDTTLSFIASHTYFYQRVLKPVIYTAGVAADGSEWIYTNGAVYFCYKPGTDYSPGAIFPRGQLELTDLPSTAPTLPPLIREVIQTEDDLITSATLTTSGSVVTGDVLLIIYATDIATGSVPTSSAGTCTQVGTDAEEDNGLDMVRVYLCPVGSDGEQTIEIAAQTTAVVLVLTDGAELDGFAKTEYTVTTATAELPSVSPTGDADLFVGIYFDNEGRLFDLSASGLVERAYPKVAGFNTLAVGTIELESSAATGTAHPAPLASNGRPVTVAVALSRP